MNSFKETDFDRLVRVSLSSALRGAEPSLHTWECIRREAERWQNLTPSPPFLRSVAAALLRCSSRVERAFFLSPQWVDRLAERRHLLLTQISVCPGSGTVPLAVI